MPKVRPKPPVQRQEFWGKFKFPRKYRSKLRDLIEPGLRGRNGVDRRRLATRVIDQLARAVLGLKIVDHLERNRATPAQMALTATEFVSDGTLINTGRIDEYTEEIIIALAEEIIFLRTNAVPFSRPSVIRELQVWQDLRAQVHAKILECVNGGRPATESGPRFASHVATILFHAGILPTVSAARDTFRSPSNFLRNPKKPTATGESLFVRVLRVLFEAAGYTEVGAPVGIASEGLRLARLGALTGNSRDSVERPKGI